MAINGAGARTQDQLHIHVDCVRADVRAALQGAAPGIGEKWADFTLLGHLYRARRIMGDDPAPDPFRLLAEDPPLSAAARRCARRHRRQLQGRRAGLRAAGAAGAGGKTHPETLLDHKCAVAAD